MSLGLEYVALLGVFLGVLARTVIPYREKVKEAAAKGEALKFDIQYFLTAISAVAISAVVSMLVFPSFAIPASLPPLYVFLNAFGFGYTSNDIINRLT